MRSVTLDLCDLNYMYEDVGLTIPAKIIAENGQDFNILLNEPVTSVQATLSMASQCISDIGKLNIVFPIDKTSDTALTHFFITNTSIQNSIDEIMCQPAATININGQPNYKTFNLGKVTSAKPININMSSTNAGTTKIGEINFTDLNVRNTSGIINNTKPGVDLSEADFYGSHINNSIINASGINLYSQSLFNDCVLVANVTGVPSPAGSAAVDQGNYSNPRKVPTIKISSSIVKNSIISGYNVDYSSPQQIINNINPEPFDAAIQFKETATVSNFFKIEGAFEGDFDWKVTMYNQNDDRRTVSTVTNHVAIRNFNSVLATFDSVGSVSFSNSIRRPSGQIIPAMPNAIPPQEERIVATYLSGAPYISTDIQTVQKNFGGFGFTPSTSITILGAKGPPDYESIGYIHVNSSLTADNIRVQYVSNLGSMTCNYLSIQGAGGPDFEGGQGAGSFLNYGTLNYEKKLGTIVNMPGGIVNGDSTEGEIV